MAGSTRQRQAGDPVAGIDTLIVDRDPLFSEGLAQLLGKHFAAGGAESLDVALGEIERGRRPRLLIIEPAAIDVRALQRIRSKVPTVKMVVLMDSDQAMPPDVAAKCDIDGCLPTNMPPETLKLSLGLIMAGQAVLPNRLASAMHGPRTAPARRFLTPRECDILRLLTLGHPSKQIARELGISVAALKAALNKLLHKIHARNRTQAAVWATDHFAGSIGPFATVYRSQRDDAPAGARKPDDTRKGSKSHT
jgi:two-component system, NarL family, nitrate/nitrite response regulator NarL